MIYIKEFFVAALAAVGFSYVFSSPKKTILVSAINAGLGWLIYRLVSMLTGSIYIGTLVSAFFIALTSEVLARIFHYPVSVFIFPGIINLCPGEAIFNTMKFFIENETSMAIITLYKALALAAAISFGVLLSSSFSVSLRNFRKRSQKRTDFLKEKK